MACDSTARVERQKEKVAKDASDKRKWEGNLGGSSSQQQNKRHKVIKAHAIGPSNRKVYARKLPYYNRFKLDHIGPCFVLCSNCKQSGHYKSDCPRWKDQNPVNKQWKGKARGDSSVMTFNVNT
ncbi:reverse transcriptase domain-containing protein [Tanacetum coccineum]